MITAKVTSKGQITIPKKVRERLGIQPGEIIDFSEGKGGFLIRKARKASTFDKWVGALKQGRRRRSTDEVIKALRGR